LGASVEAPFVSAVTHLDFVEPIATTPAAEVDLSPFVFYSPAMEKRLVLGIAPAERFILSIVLDSTIRDLNLPLSIQIISWFYSSSNWPYPAYKLG
jgi:hypothetical protein